MTVKILVFDYRETEHKFFEQKKFANYDIKFFDYSLNEQTFSELSEEDKEQAFVISVFVNSSVTKNIINGFKNLRVIAVRSTGYDNINKRACVQKNIAVLNVQNYGETSVAEFTMGLIISLVRKIPQVVISVRQNNYMKKDFVGRDLEKLTLGVVGTGAIGASVCKLANAFGMKILAYDISPKTELTQKYGVQYTNLGEMLRNSDIITLHLPYTGDNYHMFSQHEFSQMKDGAYFVNVSRGELVDTVHLKEALENGKLSSAALDVVACQTRCDECDNLSNALEVSSLQCMIDSDIVKELMIKENVIITPHIAYESQDAIDYILKVTFDGIQDFINGGNANRVI